MSFGNKDILEFTNAYVNIYRTIYNISNNGDGSPVEYLAWLINCNNIKRTSATIAVIREKFPQYNDLLNKLMDDKIKVLL